MMRALKITVLLSLILLGVFLGTITFSLFTNPADFTPGFWYSIGASVLVLLALGVVVAMVYLVARTKEIYDARRHILLYVLLGGITALTLTATTLFSYGFLNTLPETATPHVVTSEFWLGLETWLNWEHPYPVPSFPHIMLTVAILLIVFQIGAHKKYTSRN